MTILNGALVSQEQTLARERYLGTLTGRLLEATTPDAVTGILGATLDPLCELIPGLTVVTLYRGSGSEPVVVRRIVGSRGHADPDEIPAEFLAWLDPTREHVLRAVPDGTAALSLQGLPKQRFWYSLPMALPKEIERDIGVDTVLWGIPMCLSERLLGIPGPAHAEARELVRTSTRHGRIALDAVVERIQLLDRAQRDDTTGLLNRSTFKTRLESLVAAGIPLTVVFIRLTGLAEISSRYGLFETGAVVAQLAHRLTAAVGSDTVTTRFGDFAFGAALTGEVTDEFLAGLLDRLRQSLSEPATMPNGMTTRIVAHIGTGRSEPGETADQLSLRVTQALLDDVQLGQAADARN